MASNKTTVDFIVTQIGKAGQISARKMFGEYAIYCDTKMVALVCDNRLYLKPTQAARTHIGQPTEAAPYKGAKPHFLIPEEDWEKDSLPQLIRLSAAELPPPSKKRKPKQLGHSIDKDR